MLDLQNLLKDLKPNHFEFNKIKEKARGYNVLRVPLDEIIIPAFEYLFNEAYYSVREIYNFGSRKSAKTKHTALRIVYRLLTDDEYNALVMRKVASEIPDSVREELQWAINTLMVGHLFEYKIQAKTFVYIPTGQKIIQKGISIGETGKPKLSGLNVAKGKIKDVWMEEAWEFSYEDYKMIKGTMRGGIYTLIITGNPYFAHIWCVRQAINLLEPELEILKTKGQQWKYFTKKGRQLEAIVHWNNFMINSKLDIADQEERWYEELLDPKSFVTTGYGYPGSPMGSILGDLVDRIKYVPYEYFDNCVEFKGGVDVGLVKDATAAGIGGLSHKGEIVMGGEYYHSNGDQLANRFSDNGVWRKKEPDELALDVIDFFMLYKDTWIKRGKLKVAVDSADRAFINILNNKCKAMGYDDIMKFVATVGADEGKKEIESRIIFERQLLAHRKLLFVEVEGSNTMEQLLYEITNLPWKINTANGQATKVRDDSKVPDHITNMFEYLFRSWMRKIYKTLGY